MFPIKINMLSCIKSTTTSAASLPLSLPLDIIRTHILRRLDGTSLASTSCASSQLLSLCNDDQLWRNICNSTWPSTTDPRVVRAISAFPSAHRSFYSDSFLSISHELPRLTFLSDTSSLIFAVDIYYKDQVIYSKVMEMETISVQFFSHTFQLYLLAQGETVPTPLKYDGDDRACMSLAKEHLRVSCIVIDPYNKRAVNVTSHKAVCSPSQWDGGIELCYAAVAAVATGKLVQFAVVVICGWMGRELHVNHVRMQIMDTKGTLNGRESMGILQAAMEGQRRRIDCKMEKNNYKKFLRKKGNPLSLIVFLIAFPSVIFLLVIMGIVLTLVYGR